MKSRLSGSAGALTLVSVVASLVGCGLCDGEFDARLLKDSSHAFERLSTRWSFHGSDIDGDGNTDLVAEHEGDFYVLVRPMPMLADPVTDSTTLVPGVSGIHLYLADQERTLGLTRRGGDINGDGRDDLVLKVTDPDGEGALAILYTPNDYETSIDVATIGGETAGFWLRAPDPYAEFPEMAPYVAPAVKLIADLDQDGRAELVVGQEWIGHEGCHSETLAIVPGGEYPHTVALEDVATHYLDGAGVLAGDLNGDAVPDLVVDHHNGDVTIHHGPAFLSDVLLTDELAPATPSYIHKALIDDVNGDGLPEVLISRNHFRLGWHAAVVFGGLDHDIDLGELGDAGYSITPASGSAEGVEGGISVLDFNGDGLTDFAIRLSVGESGPAELAGAYLVYGQRGTRPLVLDAFPGDHDGFVIPWEPQVFGGAPDLNGDGRDELALSTDAAPVRRFFVFGTTCSN